MFSKIIKASAIFSLVLAISACGIEPDSSIQSVQVEKINSRFQITCYSPGTSGNSHVLKENSNKIWMNEKSTDLFVELNNGTQLSIMNVGCIYTEKGGASEKTQSQNNYIVTCYSPGTTSANFLFKTRSKHVESVQGKNAFYVDMPNGDKVGIVNLACITSRE